MSGYDFGHSPVRAYATTSHGLPDNGLRLFIQYTGELFGDDFEIVKPETKEQRCGCNPAWSWLHQKH